MSPRYPYIYGKVGTMPAFFWLRSRKPIAVGDHIQFRERVRDWWQVGEVTSIDPLKITPLYVTRDR